MTLSLKEKLDLYLRNGQDDPAIFSDALAEIQWLEGKLSKAVDILRKVDNIPSGSRMPGEVSLSVSEILEELE